MIVFRRSRCSAVLTLQTSRSPFGSRAALHVLTYETDAITFSALALLRTCLPLTASTHVRPSSNSTNLFRDSHHTSFVHILRWARPLPPTRTSCEARSRRVLREPFDPLARATCSSFEAHVSARSHAFFRSVRPLPLASSSFELALDAFTRTFRSACTRNTNLFRDSCFGTFVCIVRRVRRHRAPFLFRGSNFGTFVRNSGGLCPPLHTVPFRGSYFGAFTRILSLAIAFSSTRSSFEVHVLARSPARHARVRNRKHAPLSRLMFSARSRAPC